jgi:hypothetical protein
VNRPAENVSITNCTVHHAHGAVTIGSETSCWVRNLAASNITCDGTQMGVRMKSRMELHHVQIDAESGPAFLVRDSKSLELDGVSTRKPLAGTPVVRLDHCPGAIVRQSRAFPGTDTYPTTPENLTEREKSR